MVLRRTLRQLYILDEHRHLVPVGVEGEIYLSGLSTSSGYLHRPGLTAHSFLDNPFVPGLRMYKTGDIGKWLPDGNAVFLRRIDHQMKIRGYRVEPEEIRHSLEEHPSVKQALITSPRVNGEQRLAAYWTGEATVSELKAFLNLRLPSWMIPDYWIRLTAFPLTVNGKLDRASLPDPQTKGLLSSLPDEAIPMTLWQEKLSDIWKELLGRVTIGIDESFFDGGGSSLLIARLKYLVEYRLHRQVSINELFSNPTIRRQAQLIEQRPRFLTGHIPTIADDVSYPISLTQERLWLLTRYEEASVAYNMPAAFLVEGTVDIVLLQRSFEALTNRHEILRTIFPSGETMVQQVMAPGQQDNTIKILTYDVPLDEADESALLLQLARIPFQLDKGPLITATLLLNGNRSILFFNMHHLISDGWSVGTMYKELLGDYFARLRGKEPVLPVLALQYRDYAHWQQERAEGVGYRQDLAFWTGVVAGAPVLQLPTDRNRPVVKTYNGSKFSLLIGTGYRHQLMELQQRGGASLFMVLTTLVHVLLKKYSGQDDFVTGIPVAGRDHQQLEGQVGFYANTLAIRTKMDPADSFSVVLQQQKTTVLEALDHQDCPFGLVLQQLSLQRDLSRSPLFDVMILLEEMVTGVETEGSGTAFRRIPIDPHTAKYDLTFGFIHTPDGLCLDLEYNTDLYYRATVERMARHFLLVLEQVAIDPDIVIRDISLIDDNESSLLRARTDRSDVPYDESATIISLFAEAVSRYPEKIALRYGEKTLTYEELDRLSSGLAAGLRLNGGVRTGDRVLLWFQRSELMVVAIVGVLKAGAVYVPVDPDYPFHRIDYIIEDTNSQLVLAGGPPDQRICQQWPSLQWIDASSGEWLLSNAEPGADAGAGYDPVSIAPSDLAYIIYTSGTTGTPKGVMIEHRNVVRLLFNAEMPYDFCSSDKWVLFHSYCFDVSVWEIFGSLLYGGMLSILSKETIQDSRAFYDFLLEEGITILNQTPTAFRSLALNNENRFEAECLSAVRYLIFAGEALMPEILKAWREHMPACHNINMYGITETTVHVTFKEITDLEIRSNISNIGHPLPTLSLYVLDKDLQPLPPGIPGELFVGGAGVGRGYWNKAQLSAERFLPDPFYPGGRCYRSGDYARLLDTGDIEYIGRRDDQVKIRGHRIELNEVAAAIGGMPEIKDVVVLPVKDAASDSELVAYYITGRKDSTGMATTEKGISASQLRRQLQEVLPSYMIPVYLVNVPFFPMNSNGKLDKAALPGHLSGQGGEKRAVARNETDSWLIGCWERILERENISILDNFFDLGGHSIKATRVIAAIADHYGVKIDIGTFFREPTIEPLSDHLRARHSDHLRTGHLQAGLAAADGSSSASRLPSGSRSRDLIRPLPLQADYVLSSAQRRLWLLSRNEDASVAYHVHGSFIFSGNVGVPALESAFHRLLTRHEILRTVFRLNAEGEIRQTVLPAGGTGFNLEQEDLRGDPEKKTSINYRLDEFRSRPFNLAAGPLVRAAIYQTGSEEWVFACCMHHIISDGWSIDIFTRELLTLYCDPETQLSPLTIQYKDYAAWQQERLIGGTLATDRAYWLRRFSGEIPVLALPGDKIRPTVKTYYGDRLLLELENSQVTALAGVCREAGSTLFMGLLAAVNLLLHRYTGQDDIITGSPVAGRELADLDNQLGFYVNTLALRNHCPADTGFRQLLQEVRRNTLEAYQHQELPFDELVAVLPRHDPSRNPLFDVWVVVHHDQGAMPDPGFRIADYTAGADRTGRYDLMFSFSVSGDRIKAEIQYNTDIFLPGTIHRMAEHFQRLLACAVRDPDKPIGRLDMLTDDDRDELQTCGVSARLTEMKVKTIVELFESQSAASPDAIAVTAEDGQLTYAELNICANRLANYLRIHYDIRPDDLVGIRMSRSKHLVTAIWGVLKSGAAYIPIDPDYPADRIAYMMEHSRCRLLVDEIILSEVLSTVKYISENPAPVNGPDDLVYVIYTSGSTGRPKGVMIDNKALLDYHYSILDATNLRDCRSFGHFSTIAADLGNTMLFTSLLIGGELVLFPPSGILPADKGFPGAVDAVKIVPSHWKALQTDEKRFLPHKCLIFGGERLTREIAGLALTAGSGLQLYNHYGPTETTIGKLINRVDEVSGLHDITLGRPFGNTCIYVLDEGGQLTPKGMVGEIVIGGDGLSRGYLGLPELTAERFVPNPFRKGQRIYKTGDLGRWTPDNKIVFLGRKDSQLKINGYRVEPGEIEKVLCCQPGIEEAIVLGREGEEKDLRLVGYITGNGQVDVAALRQSLAGQLPAYMVPAHFVLLEKFPLTSNGKIDRNALPVPAEPVPDDGQGYLQPTNDIEVKLAEIWSEVLTEGREAVGIHDNFFHRGGHSLKAIKVMLRVHEQFQVELDLNLFYNEPTIAAQAAEIDNILWLRESSGDYSEMKQSTTI